MKSFIILVVLIISFLTSEAQVEIIMKNGESYRAIIEEQTIQKIKNIKDNSILTLDKLFIEEVKPLYTLITTVNNESFEGIIEGIDSSKIVLISNKGIKAVIERKQILHSEIVDYYSIQSYPMLGLTAGSPGILNVVGGYQLRFVGFRLETGLNIGNETNWGIKFNLLMNLLKKKRLECNIAVSCGYINYLSQEDKLSPFNLKHEWTFAGLSADINIRGFFFELGISNNINDFGEYFPLIQLGYVYRFLD